MFGKHKTTTAPTVAPAQSDQYRLKTTGRQVTLLRHLGNGNVRIAMDTGRVCREDIVNARDITPA
ncbi:hypothetical protein [Streptomyces sp. DH8]|uniref:hypothetical protein n=1 Tax=Streptomyces sp. DH8 TaxID=2857008 RepID=UPI001E30735E|nr:hypothetical protein [Streptomyces sp. DH8]